MLFLKLFYRINCQTLKIFFKFIYGKKINLGKSLHFRRRFNIMIGPHANVKIGNNVFFNHDCSISCIKSITIKDHCILGENVKIYDHNHIYNNSEVPIYKQGFDTDAVLIEKNCWIGSNVVILKGVLIGENSVIGAGNIINQSIPPNTVVINKQTHSLKKIVEM